MDVQVIHHQMDGFGFRVLKGQFENDLRELDCRAIGRGKCEVPGRLWLYRAENIGCAAAAELAFSFITEDVEDKIAIRKEMVLRCPELASPHETKQFEE